MKILVLHGSSDLYGASKILLVTLQALQEKGHQPIVVLSGPGPLADTLVGSGVELHFIRLGILRRKYKSLPGIVNRLSTLRKAYQQLIHLIKEEKVEAVYSNTMAVLVGAWAARHCHIRHIWHVHEIIAKPNLVYMSLGWMLNRYSHQVIAVSDAVAHHWSRYVNPHKINRIYNGIDYSPFSGHDNPSLRQELKLNDDTLIIGMIGRVHPWKGQDYFLEIASILAGEFKHLRFVQVGDVFPGNEYLYEQLQQSKQAKGIDHLVYDLGYRTDIPALLAGFDIFLLPSTQPDPFPTVVLEAMAAARPVVATAHGGALEMIRDAQTGILMPPDNAHIAAARIKPIIEQVTLRKEMGKAARESVIHLFSRPVFVRNIQNLFE